MANATSGDPLAYRHGVVLYNAQVSKGTAVTPTLSCGLVTVTSERDSQNAFFRGPGSPSLKARKGGGTTGKIDFSWRGIQSDAAMKTLLGKATRSSGVLPWLTVSVGYADDSSNIALDQYQDCKVASLSLSLDASGGSGYLSGSMSILGGERSALTSGTAAHLSDAPFAFYDGVMTRAGSAFPIRSFETTLNHNLTADFRIPGATPSSFLRGQYMLTEHAEEVTGRLSYYVPSGVNPWADCPSTFAMVLTLTEACSSRTLVLTYAGVSFDREQQSISEDGIVYEASFTATTLAIS